MQWIGEVLTGVSVPWAKIFFMVLGILYLVGGVLLLLWILHSGIFFQFSSYPYGDWKGKILLALECVSRLCLAVVPLAVIAAGVGIEVACSRNPVDLNGLAWSSLLPIACVVPGALIFWGIFALNFRI